MSNDLTIYYRVGCHLCDDMIFAVQELIEERACHLELIDIDRDEALRQRFNADVPVLCHGGEVICKYVLDIARLNRILDA